jgi:aminocarboxymuconate-semialdehyde decarboxylase
VAIDNAVNPRNYIGKFWIDSLVHDDKAMRYIMDVMGEDKICMGSDYPFPLGEHRPGQLIDQMDISNELKEKLFSRNAFEWLGMTAFE